MARPAPFDVAQGALSFVEGQDSEPLATSEASCGASRGVRGVCRARMAHLPWAKNPSFQRLYSVFVVFNVFNNLGNLLSLKMGTRARSRDRVLRQFRDKDRCELSPPGSAPLYDMLAPRAIKSGRYNRRG